MNRLIIAICGLLLAAGSLSRPALARDLLFWNQTEHEMVAVYLAPPGTTAWGPNLVLNDVIDYATSDDERLRIPGVAPGVYDVKLVDRQGQTCIVRNVTVKGTGKVAFAIAEEQLTNCTMPK